MPPRFVLSDADLARFWAKVDKQGPVPECDSSLGQCWVWIAGKSGGYGIFAMKPTPLRAHQVSWEIHNLGEIPPGHVIRHRCDNPACVNPSHLIVGTRGENHQDALDRGRWRYVPAGQGRRRGLPRRKGPKPGPVGERFWAKVDQENGGVPLHDASLGRCWLWIGGRDHQGYGRFFMPGGRRNGPRPKAHRIAYELFVGTIPEGLDVLHRCDVRNCVNPAHLYVGDDKDNARDRRERGREGDRRGAKNGRAKLTAKQVENIRQLYAEGGITQTALAKKYGVWQTTISGIVRGVKWKEQP